MEKLLIEGKCGLHWEPFAYPRFDLEEAKELLKELTKEEKTKRYGRQLRLVYIKKEIIKLDTEYIHEVGAITEKQWDSLITLKGQP